MSVDSSQALPYGACGEISFDPDKDARNIQERNLPLAFGAEIIVNQFGETEDNRRGYGETRIKAFAKINGLWFQCTYTMRDGVTHITTVHRVKRKEMQRWLKQSG